MSAIYNGGKYYGGSPTKTSQLTNDSNFAEINDLTKSSSATFSSEKITSDYKKIRVETSVPTEVSDDEMVVVVEA